MKRAPEFYGDLVYKLKKSVGFHNFPAQFIKIISLYKKHWLQHLCIATDCMFGGQPNHGWQLRFPLLLHASGSDFRLLKDVSIDEMVGA